MDNMLEIKDKIIQQGQISGYHWGTGTPLSKIKEEGRIADKYKKGGNWIRKAHKGSHIGVSRRQV